MALTSELLFSHTCSNDSPEISFCPRWLGLFAAPGPPVFAKGDTSHQVEAVGCCTRRGMLDCFRLLLRVTRASTRNVFSLSLIPDKFSNRCLSIATVAVIERLISWDVCWPKALGIQLLQQVSLLGL